MWSTDDDPAEVLEARATELEQIRRWVAQAAVERGG